jgi:hypothetical protein
MTWEDNHKRRVAAFPEDVRKAHDRSSNHRKEILASRSCGCFHCGAVFPPEQIHDWIDEVDGEGQTALCPQCGVDSVIGDGGSVSVSREFLDRMKSYWFATRP